METSKKRTGLTLVNMVGQLQILIFFRDNDDTQFLVLRYEKHAKVQCFFFKYKSIPISDIWLNVCSSSKTQHVFRTRNFPIFVYCHATAIPYTKINCTIPGSTYFAVFQQPVSSWGQWINAECNNTLTLCASWQYERISTWLILLCTAVNFATFLALRMSILEFTFGFGMGFLVCISIEVGKHDEKNECIESNPDDEEFWVTTVSHEEQLWGVDHHENKLCLKQT